MHPTSPIGASPFVALAANNIELAADIKSPAVVLLQRIRCFLSGKHSLSSNSYSPPSFPNSLPGSPMLERGPKKLSSAFWDAPTGSSYSSPLSMSSSASPSSYAAYHHHPGNWDQDKVQRVLEGKAVLQEVDLVDFAASVAAPPIGSVHQRIRRRRLGCHARSLMIQW